MANINMVNMNTLFRKGYLLAEVIMAANMFVVNEVKASAKADDEEKVENTFAKVLDIASGFVLSRENTINLIGGVVLSGINNYLKWWDYNPGSYCNLRNGCLGWRTKKLFDIVQVGINLNLGRGILWLIPGTYNFIKYCTVEGKERAGYVVPLYVSCLVAAFINDERWSTPALILSFLIQGFASMPLAIHISNFSISISLDSILWAGIGKILELRMEKKKKEEEEKKLKGEEELKKIDTKA